jgi:hypothetical protein
LPKDILNLIGHIESFQLPIKKYIHTGIATLRDDLYIVDRFDQTKGMYIKEFDGEEYEIEPKMVRDLYKISEIKKEDDIDRAVKKIICPYKVTYQTKLNKPPVKMSKLIQEEEMKSDYPCCYNYFKIIREELDKRDGGNGAGPIWYAYGRTQSLNYLGRKLLFPTFSNKPKFMMLNNEEALFCNGYVIVEDETINLDMLQRILNSSVMEYYVNNTSYPIEGGYYCYQKKFIEHFSIPELTSEQKDQIMALEGESLDQFIRSMYSVPLNM